MHDIVYLCFYCFNCSKRIVFRLFCPFLISIINHLVKTQAVVPGNSKLLLTKSPLKHPIKPPSPQYDPNLVGVLAPMSFSGSVKGLEEGRVAVAYHTDGVQIITGGVDGDIKIYTDVNSTNVCTAMCRVHSSLFTCSFLSLLLFKSF